MAGGSVFISVLHRGRAPYGPTASGNTGWVAPLCLPGGTARGPIQGAGGTALPLWEVWGPGNALDVFAVESQQVGLVGQVVQDGLELVMRSQAPRHRQVEEGLGVGCREQLLRHWLWPMPLSSLAGECG